MSAGSAICGRCFAVYQEGYGHVCATAQADWRSLSDDLAAALEETAKACEAMMCGSASCTHISCDALDDAATSIRALSAPRDGGGS